MVDLRHLFQLCFLALLAFSLASCDDEDDEEIIEPADKISSGFEDDAEGWTIAGDAQGGSSVVASYSPFEGLDDSGYIYAEDDVTGGTWYFVAPSKFEGDQSEFFGGFLSYWLIQYSNLSDQFDNKDIIIKGAGTEIHYRYNSYPGLEWTEYVVNLSATAGWKNEAGDPASSEEIQAVLGDVEAIWIRGEFETGSDTGGLDQFEINKS